MTCPNCKGELSKVWQPQRDCKTISIVQAQWSCSTCGDTFNRAQLRPAPKKGFKATPLQPV